MQLGQMSPQGLLTHLLHGWVALVLGVVPGVAVGLAAYASR